jgi:hypothetical protein
MHVEADRLDTAVSLNAPFGFTPGVVDFLFDAEYFAALFEATGELCLT